MKIDRATAIALDVWKDPQSYVLIEHVRDEAWLYFRCWENPNFEAQYVGCLHFEGVWHLASSRFKRIRGYPDIETTDLVSYYLFIENSSLASSLKEQRSADDPDWEKFDKRAYKHWVVESHDFYTDIVASSVLYLKVEGENAKQIFAIWDKI